MGTTPSHRQNTVSCSQHPSQPPLLWRSLNLRQGHAADVYVYLMAAFDMQRKKKTLLSRAGIQKENFSCKKIKVQEESAL